MNMSQYTLITKFKSQLSSIVEEVDESDVRNQHELEIGKKVQKAIEMVTAHLLAITREEMNRYQVQVNSTCYAMPKPFGRM